MYVKGNEVEDEDAARERKKRKKLIEMVVSERNSRGGR